jgi:hypothetical protein
MTTNNSRLEVWGRPVEGTIRPTSERQKEQANPLEFLAALDAVLDYPGVLEYKWEQYTPYWNDGEECTFSANGEWGGGAKLEFGDKDGGDREDGYYSTDYLGYSSWRSTSADPINGVDVTELAKLLDTIESELGSGHHDVFLKDSFGDHATVYATKDGFRIEYYNSHD